MNTQQSVERDERTVAVENASYKWALNFTMFALLIDVAYRGLVRDEAAWDLLALVVVPAFVCTIYQYRQKTKTLGWPSRKTMLFRLVMAIVAIVAAVIAAIVAMIRSM